MLSYSKIPLFILISLFFLSACGSAPTPARIDSAALYVDHCADCHGPHAQGIFNLAPCLRCEKLFTNRLEEVAWTRSLEGYLTSVISIGRQESTRPDYYPGAVPVAMPGFSGGLSEQEIAALASFLLTFESEALMQISPAGDIPSELETRPEDPILFGLVLFRRRGCVSCHAVSDISTGTAGPSLNGLALRAADRITDYSAEEYIRESILAPGAYVVEGFTPGVMPQSFETTLDPDELNALVDFLLTLK